MDVKPFEVRVTKEVLDDLRERLARTRWPDEVAAAGMGIGALLITALATGVAMGMLQWRLFLQGRLLVAILWPPLVAITWALGWTATLAAGVDVERATLCSVHRVYWFSRRSPPCRCYSCSAA